MNKACNFVFVESPNKIKIMNNILTNTKVISNFKVLSTKGHVRAVHKYDNKTIGQEIRWIELSHVKNIIKSLVDMKFNNDHNIYMATDSDREGEAICWHMIEILKKHFNYNKRIIRVYYKELNDKVINQAFIDAINNNITIDNRLVNAYKARVIIDLIIGMNGSRILWDKLVGCKSIGRVQTVSIISIFEKEQHIRQFVATKYYSILCNLPYYNEYIKMHKLIIEDKNIDKIETQEEAERIIQLLLQKQYKLHSITKTEKTSSAPKPLDTTDLIIKAGSIYKLSTNEVYRICQKLYEGIEITENTITGLITYMRTDSNYISDTFVPSIKKYITDTYGAEYYNEIKLSRKQHKNQQEAHEAIRITTFDYSINTYQDVLNIKEFKLLKIIFLHTVGVFMKPALYTNNEIVIRSTDEKVTIIYMVNNITFDGVNKLKRHLNITDDDRIIDIDILISNINNIHFMYEEKYTKCPDRHSESSLIKELKDKGIGRPSTYNYIITVIKNREYVFMNKQRYHITSKGIMLVMFVYVFMHEFINYNFTHIMEQMLDDITTNKADYNTLLDMFTAKFVNTLNNINQYTKIQIIQRVIEKIFDTLGRQCINCGSENTVIKFIKLKPYVICTCGTFNEVSKQGYKDKKYIVNEQYTAYYVRRKINKIQNKNKKQKK